MPNLTISHVASKQTFKHYELLSTDGRGKVRLNGNNVLNFLKDRGFFLYRHSPTKSIYIRIIQNIVKEVGLKDILDEVIKFSKEENDAFEYDELLAHIGAWFPDKFFLLLDEKKVDIKRDKKDEMQLYFSNCIVRVTKKGIKIYDYTQLNGYIWESQIIQRNFEQIEYESFDTNFDYCTFIYNISGKNPDRILTINTSIGYLLHNYKDPSKAPAIILNDEVMSDEPEGGTGKGLIGQTIGKFCSTVPIEGKTFTFDKGFLYSRINQDTRVLFFEDVKKNFDFERLFSVLTDGVTVEKKGINEIYFAFKDTPKVLISTNYAIKGSSTSYRRRKFEIEISQHYSDKYTPFDNFKRLLFDDWDIIDWNKFDNYIINCCQLYLTHGLVRQDLINLEEKRLIVETSQDFIEFCDDYKLEGRIPKQKMFDDFISINKKFNAPWFTRIKMQSYLKAYCENKKIEVELNGFDTTKTIRCFVFKEPPEPPF